MNCLPPTSLFVMGTLHQVQSRSGRSEKSAPVSGGGGVIGMRGILSERREACQPTDARPGRALSPIFFRPSAASEKIRVIVRALEQFFHPHTERRIIL